VHIGKILLTSPIPLICQPEPHWLSKQRIFCSCGWQFWITKAMFVNRYLPCNCDDQSCLHNHPYYKEVIASVNLPLPYFNFPSVLVVVYLMYDPNIFTP